jgi:hypothetical protein
MMAGYARGPYARVADERNRLISPFDQPPPAPVTPGEVPDVAPPADWFTRLSRRQTGNPNIDKGMEAAVVPRPLIDPGMINVYEQTQLPDLVIAGGLETEASARQAPMNPNDPRYARWLQLMRQRGSI